MSEEPVQVGAPDPTADDLAGAVLVVIVPASFEARMWTSDDVPLSHHAVMLRSLADRLDPPPLPS